MSIRYDETWHRLSVWTNGSAQSERLAAQVLLASGYADLDPIHPRGGPDGGQDARCKRDGKPWVMAVYFAHEKRSFATVKKKFQSDLAKLAGASGMAFVTNQELTHNQRDQLKKIAGTTEVDIFHIERITALLDQPSMAPVRKQFLGISDEDDSLISFGGIGGIGPGAGGGGGAAIGPNSRGGDGGTGGQIIVLENLPVTPGEAYKIIVGQGGRGGEEGKSGEAGGDTSFGNITVKGARGGAGANSTANASGSSALDVQAILSDAAAIRDGVLFVLGAGWERCNVPTVPHQVMWCLALVLTRGATADFSGVTVTAEVLEPNGTVVLTSELAVDFGASRPLARLPALMPLQITISTAGAWQVRLMRDGSELVTLVVDVQVLPQ